MTNSRQQEQKQIDLELKLLGFKLGMPGSGFTTEQAIEKFNIVWDRLQQVKTKTNKEGE